MPCGGGDIGLNVWVEDGDVLFYMQRSGSLAEQNEYLKLGRVRLRLDPNPFKGPGAEFRQELKLRDGHVEIEGRAPGPDGKPLKSLVRIWVDVHRRSVPEPPTRTGAWGMSCSPTAPGAIAASACRTIPAR